MPVNKSKDIKELKKFDVDLAFGQQWEEYIDDVFSGAKTIEVKTERHLWHNTGNICMEVQSWGKPSGLDNTEADLWVHNLIKDDELLVSMVFPTNKLREMVDEIKPRTVMGGDHNASMIKLLSLRKLIDYMLS
jgi:hypothetical protein